MEIHENDEANGGCATLLVLVGGAAAAETVQSSEGTVYTLPANVSRI